jgi:hypothetical protein
VPAIPGIDPEAGPANPHIPVTDMQGITMSVLMPFCKMNTVAILPQQLSAPVNKYFELFCMKVHVCDAPF